MAVYKREKCPKCRYIHNVPDAHKEKNKPCPNCGEMMRYLPNWYVSFYFGPHQKVEAVGPNRRMALDVEAKRKVEIREGRYFDKAPETTWEEAAAMLMLHNERQVKRGNMSPATERMYSNSLQHLKSRFKGFFLNQITASMVEEMIQARVDQGLKNGTVNRDIACVKRVFNLCAEKGLLDPTRTPEHNRIQAIRLLKEEARERFLNTDEVTKLLNECSHLPYLRMAVLTALNAGLRKDGSVSLEWADIDFDRDTIKKTVKGGKVVRIPLFPEFKAALIAYRKHGAVLSRYVIPNPRDPRNPLKDPKKSFKAALNRSGIKDFRWHDLRHTFASWFYMRTGDLYALAEIMGVNVDIVTRRYAHLNDDHKRKQMEKFGGLGL